MSAIQKDSILFEPLRLGGVESPNRFVRSATYEALATDEGAITPQLVRYYRTLGRGRIGVIISSIAYVSPEGKGPPRVMGIEQDDRIPGLRDLATAAKAEGSAFFVQLVHAGGQASKRIMHQRPLAPSDHLRDPMLFERPRALTGEEIERIIDDFSAAALRAMEAGADGVQLHGAHGYLIAEFLSPFFNQRTDEWGGSPENRFRFLREVILNIRRRAGEDVPVMVKMVHDDGTPEPGMTPELAADVAGRLAELGVAALELSAGGTNWAPFRMCRGEVPVDELARAFPWWIRWLTKKRLRAMMDKAALEPNYNAGPAEVVKEALGEVPLILVGGLREMADMQRLVSSGPADMVSLCRPFIRQPRLVKWFELGKYSQTTCTSCNRCFAAIFNTLPLRCYVKGLPKKKPK